MEQVETYVMYNEQNRLYKIGFSQDPIQRCKIINRKLNSLGLSGSVHLLITIKGNLEWGLHKEYSHLRTYGEWFKLTKLDLSDIIARNECKFITKKENISKVIE